MNHLRTSKLIIYTFCILLMGVGILTLVLHPKPIAKTTFSAMQTAWQQEKTLTSGITGIKNGIEQSVTENIFAKEKYIDWYGLMEKISGRRYIRDTNTSYTIVKDNHDLLQFITFKADSTKKVEAIKEIKDQLLRTGTPLIFVQTPLKVIEGFTQLPTSVIDYSNSNTDAFLQALDESGIDYIDLRKAAAEDALDKETLFYKTDHHWSTHTAFWAVGKVVEKLQQEYAINLDKQGFYTNIENYEVVTLEKSFLGSQGRRVGRYYAGLDDYTLITPKFHTSYHVTINKSDSSTVYQGDFEEVIVHKSLLDADASVYTNRYAAYFGADYPEVIINNKTAQNDKKILIIKDSFALPFTAFLSTMTAQTRMLDLRYYDEAKLEAYIEEFNPDLVLYVYKSVVSQ